MAEPSVLNASAAPRTNNVHQNKNVYELLIQNITQGKSKTTGVYKRPRNEKIFVSTNRPYGDKALHEIEILTALDGLPGIISLEDFEEYSKKNGKFIKIYTPYMKSDLITFFNNLYKNIIFDIFKQIIEAVIGMHTKSICHLDLKFDNIVIDNSNKIYIIDFEYAKVMDENGMFKINSVFGTKAYLPNDITEYFISKRFKNNAIQLDNHTANGCEMDMYAVCTMIIIIISDILLENKDLIIELFKTYRKACNQANLDLEFQKKLLQIIEIIPLVEDRNGLQQIINDIKSTINPKPTEGGYKKPRRKIHKQYTRKRRTNKS